MKCQAGLWEREPRHDDDSSPVPVEDKPLVKMGNQRHEEGIKIATVSPHPHLIFCSISVPWWLVDDVIILLTKPIAGALLGDETYDSHP
jgi:hypothetical protein